MWPLLWIPVLIVLAIAAAWLVRRWRSGGGTFRVDSHGPDTSVSSLDEVPDWASFFTPEQYDLFCRLVSGYFNRQKTRHVMDDGVVAVIPDKGQPRQHGLLNLAQICRALPEQQWATTIAEHFGRVRKVEEEKRHLDADIGNYEKVSHLLATRLFSPAYLQSVPGEQLVTRNDIPHTVTALVFDLPSAVRTVHADEADAWGKSHDELLRRGLDNVRISLPPEWQTIDLEEGVQLLALESESFFAASYALMLDEFPQAVGSRGALVGIPTRHVLLCYPIDDVGVIQAIEVMIRAIYEFEKQGPGSLSEHLYWHHEGEMIDLPYRITGERIQFTPPPEFVQLLNDLAENQDNDDQ